MRKSFDIGRQLWADVHIRSAIPCGEQTSPNETGRGGKSHPLNGSLRMGRKGASVRHFIRPAQAAQASQSRFTAEAGRRSWRKKSGNRFPAAAFFGHSFTPNSGKHFSSNQLIIEVRAPGVRSPSMKDEWPQ